MSEVPAYGAVSPEGISFSKDRKGIPALEREVREQEHGLHRSLSLPGQQ